MTRAFVDTDVIIRLLTGDDPVKQQAAARLFEAVEQGEIELLAPDTVVADAVYVLSSPRLYQVARPEVRDLLSALVRLPRFALENKTAVLRALEIYGASRLDFGDALIIASMEVTKMTYLYSFDHDFDSYPNVERCEPAA